MPDTADRAAAQPMVVTLFEQYGAGASYVGEKVAQALGMPFHAQAFSSADIEVAESATEEGALLAQVFSVMGGAYGSFEGRDIVTTQQQKYELVMNNNRDIWDKANAGGVIVGRNGAFILAERANTLHVLLTGAVDDRIERAARAENISRERAEQRQQSEDRVRADMSIVLYGWDPRLPDRYDVVFNTSRISLDATVDAIRAAAALRATTS